MRSIKKIAGLALALVMASSSVSALPAVYAESAVNTAYVSSSKASASESRTDSIISSSGYKTSYTSRYGYKKLTSSEKTLYKRIVAAVKDIQSAVEIPGGLSDDQIMRVYTTVFNNEPQLFWMGSSFRATSNYLYIQYKTTELDEIEKMQTAMNKTVKNILSSAKKQSTTYGKLKVFYDYIVTNNDFILDESGYNTTIYAGFTKSESLQCVGYARTMQYLCDLAGIESMVITGINKEGGSHAWNIVKCGDGYYHLDTTWGDPINKYNTAGSKYIQYEFFLVPDSWIKNISHFNINQMTRSNGKTVTLFNPPACTKTKYNYFIKNGLNYSSVEKGYAGLQKQVKAAIKNKSNVAEIRVTTKAAYQKLLSKEYQQKVLKYAKSLSSNVKSVAIYNNNLRDGSYVVHYDIVYKK